MHCTRLYRGGVLLGCWWGGGVHTCTVLCMACRMMSAWRGSGGASRAACSALTMRAVRAADSGRTSTRSQMSRPSSPTCNRRVRLCTRRVPARPRRGPTHLQLSRVLLGTAHRGRRAVYDLRVGDLRTQTLRCECVPSGRHGAPRLRPRTFCRLTCCRLR